MNEYITTNGIVLKTSNVGEYNRRMVVLTQDYGKITIFARGVRRQNSKFMAACSPFCFGQIKAFPGKEAYSLLEINVSEFFEDLRKDFDISCMGMYFLEIADFYCRENIDEIQMLKLLYVTLKMLERIEKGESQIPIELVRCIYEIKAIAVNGEFPGIVKDMQVSDSVRYAIDHIVGAKMEKLYTFSLMKNSLEEMKIISKYYRNRFLNGRFKSLELIDNI